MTYITSDIDEMDDNLSIMRACQAMITAWRGPPNMLYVRHHLLPRYFKAQADAIGFASRSQPNREG